MGTSVFLIVLSLFWGVYSNNNAKLESKPKPFLFNISHLETLKERGISDSAIDKYPVNIIKTKIIIISNVVPIIFNKPLKLIVHWLFESQCYHISHPAFVALHRMHLLL